MKKFGLLGASALGSSAFVGFALLVATPAYAQGGTGNASQTLPPCRPDQPAGQDCTTSEPTTTAAKEEPSAAITVTGTRIRRPNLESTVPITSIGGEQFFQQADTN